MHTLEHCKLIVAFLLEVVEGSFGVLDGHADGPVFKMWQILSLVLPYLTYTYREFDNALVPVGPGLVKAILRIVYDRSWIGT